MRTRPALDDPKQAERRELHNGFGDALVRAFELVVTPAVFAWFGWLLDRWLGTEPLFMLTFALIVFLYEVWKLFIRYDAAMSSHQAKLLGSQARDVAAPPTPDHDSGQDSHSTGETQ
jgi:F0F1-type ATP synthase assembly protein I